MNVGGSMTKSGFLLMLVMALAACGCQAPMKETVTGIDCSSPPGGWEPPAAFIICGGPGDRNGVAWK